MGNSPNNIRLDYFMKTSLNHQKFIIIGVSTGGPVIVEQIIGHLPADFPLPIIVIQHMPEKFTRLFAERLNNNSLLQVNEVQHPVLLEKGRVYIAQGNTDIEIVQCDNKLHVKNSPASDAYLHHPSIDRFMHSVAENCEAKSVICVLLTGMGHDGAHTMAALHEQGAQTIAESEETAVVYGMPKKLIELGGADSILPAYSIVDKLIEWSPPSIVHS